MKGTKVERINLGRRQAIAGMLVACMTPLDSLLQMIGVRGTREAVAGNECRCLEVPTHVTLDKLSASQWNPKAGYLPGDMVFVGNDWYVLACHNHCEPGKCKFWFKLPPMHPVTLKANGWTYELNDRHEIKLSFDVVENN